MSRWLVTEYPPGAGHTEAVWVEAADEEAAAQTGIDYFESEDGLATRDPKGEVGPIEHVFVVAVDTYSAYRVRAVPTLADPEFACCGGPIALTRDGHSGFCPEHRNTDAGDRLR